MNPTLERILRGVVMATIAIVLVIDILIALQSIITEIANHLHLP
jgi:hypothetical protein